jgi:hypothetical protein
MHNREENKQVKEKKEGKEGKERDWGHLLWSEFPHVKRCVKRVLEDAAMTSHVRELSYAAALQRTVDLYDSERAYRAAERDPLALALDALDFTPPFRCAVSAALFSANCDIASLLVSQDPLVKAGEEFLRSTVEERAVADRSLCTFEAVLDAYMSFARLHAHKNARPVRARVGSGGALYTFPFAAAWAAFIANKSLWQRLPGAPKRELEQPVASVADPVADPVPGPVPGLVHASPRARLKTDAGFYAGPDTGPNTGPDGADGDFSGKETTNTTHTLCEANDSNTWTRAFRRKHHKLSSPYQQYKTHFNSTTIGTQTIGTRTIAPTIATTKQKHKPPHLPVFVLACDADDAWKAHNAKKDASHLQALERAQI